MTALEALNLIAAVSLYCTGAGGVVEGGYVRTTTSEKRCFEKMWKCGHDTKDANVIAFETHNCITKHLEGKLK